MMKVKLNLTGSADCEIDAPTAKAFVDDFNAADAAQKKHDDPTGLLVKVITNVVMAKMAEQAAAAVPTHAEEAPADSAEEAPVAPAEEVDFTGNNQDQQMK